MPIFSANDWNSKYPKGTPVKYFPQGKKAAAKPIDTKTRGPAYHLSSGAVIVPLAGGLHGKLANIEPIDPKPAALRTTSHVPCRHRRLGR
jgi:hypothetical protein